MNNNRGNNRRRGRGNNRQQGGGQQLNRIDSRARGNAPQLLEKYRKLAHDAHLNGDRVTEEYYLQFADHYFRVIADTRVRQEEARLRRDDRWQEGGSDADRYDGDDGSDYIESDYPAYDQPVRRERNERPERQERAERPREEAQPQAQSEERGEEPVREDAERSPYEPPENPFVRDNRARTPKPRREPREERRPRRERAPAADAEPVQGELAGIDPAVLAPAITPAPVEAVAEVAEAEAPKPKRRTRRPRAADEAGDALEKVAS